MHGNKRSPVTRLQPTACVFQLAVCILFYAEGITLFPFSGGFLRTTYRFVTTRHWSDPPYFRLRRHCLTATWAWKSFASQQWWFITPDGSTNYKERVPGYRPHQVTTRAQQLLRWVTVPEQSGPKSGGCCAPFLWGGGAGSSSNTMSAGPRYTSVASGILLHPTVWPQYTNDRSTDRQTDRTTVP